MKKIDWIIVGVLVCTAIGLFVYFDRVQILEFVRAQKQVVLPEPVTFEETKKIETNVPSVPVAKAPSAPIVPAKTEPSKTVLAAEINLAVPFTIQAPTGDWGQPYQDACEEASVLMVKEYYAKNTAKTIDAAVATKEILAMVAYQDKIFGYNIDTTSSETAQFAEKIYRLGKSEILENPTVDQIKERLNLGQPVIVPVAGQMLKNPYFTAPGPKYHMLVIRGYTKDGNFITNDPGTKRGAAYLYSFETIMNAIHDWNGEADIQKGKRMILILHPGK